MRIIVNHFRDKSMQRAQDPAGFMGDAVAAMTASAVLVLAVSAFGVVIAGNVFDSSFLVAMVVNIMHLVLMGMTGVFLADFFTALWHITREYIISVCDNSTAQFIMTAVGIGFAVLCAGILMLIWLCISRASDGMVRSLPGVISLFGSMGGVHNV